MPNIASARKRNRQTKKLWRHNMAYRSMLRTRLKKTLRLIEQGDYSVASTSYRETASLLDRLARKSTIHRNKAARHKSRLTARLRKIAP